MRTFKDHIMETGFYAELISSNTEFYQMFQSQMLPQPTHQDQVL